MRQFISMLLAGDAYEEAWGYGGCEWIGKGRVEVLWGDRHAAL